MSGSVVRAARGAITVTEDTGEAIRAATLEVLTALLERNSLAHDDLISIIFTVTPDLYAEFPAVAARELGMADVPLLCAQEIPVVGSMPMCIRVLLHCNMPAERDVRHVYLRDAANLRPDLAG